MGRIHPAPPAASSSSSTRAARRKRGPSEKLLLRLLSAPPAGSVIRCPTSAGCGTLRHAGSGRRSSIAAGATQSHGTFTAIARSVAASGPTNTSVRVSGRGPFMWGSTLTKLVRNRRLTGSAPGTSPVGDLCSGSGQRSAERDGTTHLPVRDRARTRARATHGSHRGTDGPRAPIRGARASVDRQPSEGRGTWASQRPAGRGGASARPDAGGRSR
jgi:hypothetical protein